MTPEGFSCIFSFFLLLNQNEKKIYKLLPQSLETSSSVNTTVGQYPPAPKMTSFSNTSGGQYQNYSFTNKNNSSDNEDHGFHIMVAPWDLLGIEGIWQIALNAQNHDVANKSIALLIRCYTSPTFELEPRLTEFEDAFLNHCIEKIQQLQINILSRE